jgi:hypothetical protein
MLSQTTPLMMQILIEFFKSECEATLGERFIVFCWWIKLFNLLLQAKCLQAIVLSFAL